MRLHAQTATASTEGPESNLTIELRDGSRIMGTGLDDSMSFHSTSMGDLKLTWADIRSIECAKDTDTAHLMAANGDVYEVHFEATEVMVETSLGKKELPVNQILSIKVALADRANATRSPGVIDKTKLHMTIELKDGSRVVGKIPDESLSFHSATLGDVKLPWAAISTMEYNADTDTAHLTANNGDSLTVQLSTETLHLDTIIGKSEVPVKLIRDVWISARGTESEHLIGWWKLDEGSGIVARDSSSNENPHDGTISDASMWAQTPGPDKGALQFNGAGQNVSLGNVLQEGYSEISITCWIKCSSNGFQTVIERGVWDASDGLGMIINYGPVEFGHYPRCPQSQISVSDNRWHHLAGTLSHDTGGPIYKIYVDGKLENSLTLSSGLTATSQSWFIGTAPGGAYPYKGLMKDVRIYDHALSPTEVDAVYSEEDNREPLVETPLPAPSVIQE